MPNASAKGSLVNHLTGKRKLKKPLNGYIDDAADALAVAICHVLKTSKLDSSH